jgi:thiol-disulfide isomerase/thioredoxin
MRSQRPALLALALASIALIASGGLLLGRLGWTGAAPSSPPADQTLGQIVDRTGDEMPLGRFIPASPPQPAPPVSFTDTAGKTVTLADFGGRVVLLNLWATWCVPCRHEMPSLVRLQTRFGDKIAVLAVSQDFNGNKVVVPFIAKLGLTAIKTYLDPKSAVGRAFKVAGLPTTFLIDRQGRVRGRVEGEADWDSPRMLAVIEPLLAPDDIVKTSFPQAHP